jgi:hypothetical protein
MIKLNARPLSLINQCDAGCDADHRETFSPRPRYWCDADAVGARETERGFPMFNARAVFIAAAMTLAGGAAVGAASLAATYANGPTGACAGQTWPNLSADCVDGMNDRPVRVVSVDRTNADDMSVRFAVAFQQPPKGAAFATLG